MLTAVAMAVLGLVAARRRDASRSSQEPTDPSLRPSARIPAGASATRAESDEPPVRSCPVCLTEYPPGNRFCVRDGAPLNDGRISGPFSHGMICPTCRRGYASDASFCPEDADELVPYGLFAAAHATRSPMRLDTHKICPECGVRHRATHVFCGNDGCELVVVN